jgi:hypothetical protein
MWLRGSPVCAAAVRRRCSGGLLPALFTPHPGGGGRGLRLRGLCMCAVVTHFICVGTSAGYTGWWPVRESERLHVLLVTAVARHSTGLQSQEVRVDAPTRVLNWSRRGQGQPLRLHQAERRILIGSADGTGRQLK